VAGGEGGITDAIAILAKVWKNGIATALPPNSGMGSSSAYAIAVSGSDVYVAGAEISIEYDGTTIANITYIPTVWKNGVATALPLTDDTSRATANAIAVSGSDVYVAGNEVKTWSEYDDTTDTTAVYVTSIVTVWKNGTATVLNESTNSVSLDDLSSAAAYAIAVVKK